MSTLLNIAITEGVDWSGDFAYASAASGDAIIMIFYNDNISCTQIATTNYSGKDGEVVIDPGVKYTCTLPDDKTFKLDTNVTYKLFILNLELQEATLLYHGGVSFTADPEAVSPDIWDGQYPTVMKTVNSLPGVEYYKAGDEVCLLGDGKYLHNGSEWVHIGLMNKDIMLDEGGENEVSAAEIIGSDDAEGLLLNANNLRLTSKTVYNNLTTDLVLRADGTASIQPGYQVSDYIEADTAYTTKYIETTFDDDVTHSVFASVCYYDASNKFLFSELLQGNRTIAVRQPYKVKICTGSGVTVYVGTTVETYQTVLFENDSSIDDLIDKEYTWFDKANSSGLTNANWVLAKAAILGLELSVDSSKSSNTFRINTFCTTPTSVSTTLAWKMEIKDETDGLYFRTTDSGAHTGIQLLEGTSTDGLRSVKVLVDWDKLPDPFELFSNVAIRLNINTNSWKVETYQSVLSKKSKTMVWFGTSIPTQGIGTDSYPELIADTLQMTCYNEAVGGSCVRAGGNNTAGNYGLFKGLHCGVLLKAMSHTIAEKQQIMDYWSSGLNSSGEIEGGGTYGYRDFQVDYVADWSTLHTEEFILGCSYENKLVAKYLDSTDPDFIEVIDYFVLDHGHNDLVQTSYDADEASAIAVPSTRNDRTTFIGAMNYLVDVILSYNPRARIFFVGHYENDRKPRIWQAQEKLFEYWDFPSLKLWEKVGWSQQEVETTGYWDNGVWYNSGGSSQTLTITEIWMEDDLHPSTLITRQLLANIITPFIKDNY